MKIADAIVWSLFMRDNEKCNISHAPLHRLEQYSILNTAYIGVIDRERFRKKYNNSVMNYVKISLVKLQKCMKKK